jgi:hypothetical protein
MLLAKQWGWDGWWMGLVVFAIGVGTVVQDLFDRRRRKVDEPTTLDIHGRFLTGGAPAGRSGMPLPAPPAGESAAVNSSGMAGNRGVAVA